MVPLWEYTVHAYLWVYCGPIFCVSVIVLLLYITGPHHIGVGRDGCYHSSGFDVIGLLILIVVMFVPHVRLFMSLERMIEALEDECAPDEYKGPPS